MNTKPKHTPLGLTTPIYIKENADDPWPEDKVFYMLASNGLFLCRDHEFYRSCAAVKKWPSELADQRAYLEPTFPSLSKQTMQEIVGFFGEMARQHQCEVGVYLVHDKTTGEVLVKVPKQLSTVSEGWNNTRYPIGMKYDSLDPLPAHQAILGTVHSHVYQAAYSSGIDIHDEVDKPGMHLVVGRLDQDPPDFHAEAVVDGMRFPLDVFSVIDDYQSPAEFPEEWMDQVTVKVNPRWNSASYSSYSSTKTYDMPRYEDTRSSGGYGYGSGYRYADDDGYDGGHVGGHAGSGKR